MANAIVLGVPRRAALRHVTLRWNNAAPRRISRTFQTPYGALLTRGQIRDRAGRIRKDGTGDSQKRRFFFTPSRFTSTSPWLGRIYAFLAAVLRLWPHRHGGVEPEVLTGAAAAPTGGLNAADRWLQQCH